MTRPQLSLCLLAAALLLPRLISAQNADNTTKSVRETADYRGPLPFYYGKLGLSDAQKEQFYGIQKQYAQQITELQKQIEKLEDERDAKMETHLTEGQKLRLKELRDEARQRSATRDEKQDAKAGAVTP